MVAGDARSTACKRPNLRLNRSLSLKWAGRIKIKIRITIKIKNTGRLGCHGGYFDGRGAGRGPAGERGGGGRETHFARLRAALRLLDGRPLADRGPGAADRAGAV